MATAPSSKFRHASALEALGKHLRRVHVGTRGRDFLRRMYHRALMAGTGGRGLRADLPGGETVRISPHYRYMAWNAEEYAAFRAAVGPGGIVLDVGANVGAYTMLLAQWVGPSGAVFAFEPAPAAYAGLVEHVRLNRLGANVRSVRTAIADATSNVLFKVAGTAGEGRLAIASDRTDETSTVPVTTLDEFCATEHLDPTFIKIDVEGSELAVLRGARETLRRRRGRIAVFVELHPSIWPHIGTSRAELDGELSAQGLTLEPITPGGDAIAVDGLCLRVIPR